MGNSHDPRTHDPSTRLPRRIVEAAIAWMVRLDFNPSSADDRQAFEHWLAADPAHALAWQRVRQLDGPFAVVPPDLLRATHGGQDPALARRRRSLRSKARLLALATLTLGSAWLVREHTPWQRLIADASTSVGESRTMLLADGTTIRLNTDSAINLQISADARRVVLRRGEIQVRIGTADARSKRPFSLECAAGRVESLDAQFLARLVDDRLRVTVTEGAVVLHPDGGGSGRLLGAGDTRWLSAGGVEAADLRGLEAGSWVEGVVAGRNIRLADLLAELARYRPGHLHCEDSVADLRASGLYLTADVDQTLDFLAQALPIRIRRLTPLWVSVGPARVS